jgi:hypothetical protein
VTQIVAHKPLGFAFTDCDDRRDVEDAIHDLDGMLAVSFG